MKDRYLKGGLMRKSILGAAVTAVITAVFLVGCGGNSGGSGSKPSSLSGQWVHVSGAKGDNYPESMELYKDGTGLVDGFTVSWKVENKRLVILSSMAGLAFNYKISGYELDFTYDGGDSAKFVRKEKLEEFKIKRIERLLGQYLVPVQGGTFTMGCTAEQGKEDCEDDENPSHMVTVGDYYIGKTEITTAQFCKFLNDKGIGKDGQTGRNILVYYSGNNNEKADWRVNYTGDKWESVNGYENHPIVFVSWYGAEEFSKWVGGRLPTEAEWEYAARGGNKSKGYVYSGSNNLGEVGWYYENSGDKVLDYEEWDYGDLVRNNNRTHPVGQKKPNELGIYDMSGNVWEWCGDWYGDYSASGVTNPTGPSKGVYRVYRGGSWSDSARCCLVAGRSSINPSISIDNVGFRVVFPVN